MRSCCANVELDEFVHLVPVGVVRNDVEPGDRSLTNFA